MIYHLMIQELYWNANNTSLTNVKPETPEIRPGNFDKGIVLWFEWDTRNNILRSSSDSERESICKFPFSGAFERRCTTTLLYCESVGFSAIPYNPLRGEDNWPYWWSLGFQMKDGEQGNVYKVERDDVSFKDKRIAGNESGWFHLFRDTDHHLNPGVINPDRPLLTGAASLIWALAAFRFDAGTLEKNLPSALRRDGMLHVLPGDTVGPLGRKSQRALAVEVWVPGGGQATVRAPYLC